VAFERVVRKPIHTSIRPSTVVGIAAFNVNAGVERVLTEYPYSRTSTSRPTTAMENENIEVDPTLVC